MLIKLPSEIIFCLETIESYGFEAYCVGGAIRDHIIGITPFDYDITTNALPQDIINMFEKTVPTGIKHGTVTVIVNKMNIEVTTYRSDDGYLNHRKPNSVTYINNIVDDLSRRDFTMNAVCFNQKSGLFDPMGGIADIKNKQIRAIGDPKKRFSEDALRIMRAFRFSCQLGFEIEENTLNAALSTSKTLTEISAERIAFEFKKSIISDFPQRISPLLLNGALASFNIPKIDIPDDINALPKNFSIRFAWLCNKFDIDDKVCLELLKFDNKTKTESAIYRKMLSMPSSTSYDIKKMLSISDVDFTKNVLLYKNKEALKLLDTIINNNEPYCLPMLKIDGNDLVKLGFVGSDINKTLSLLLEKVIANPKLNNKNDLLKIAKNNKTK